MKIKGQDIRLAVTVAVAIVGTGYLMAVFGNNPIIAQSRMGYGG
ncbi:hypothetical protein [Cognatiyoonia sp. IB215182]|nr:hypothetical protein [Cognatiyoonia sp. IB215182]MDX8353668.1 hypothetical protein [Cognatiyoonia sp. IB215182]